jgi:hypothetical protein
VATLYQVLVALQQQVSSITTGLVSNSPDTFGLPLTVEVGLYWPSAKSLQNNVRRGNAPGGQGPSSLVTIYDRGLAADSTRWVPNVVGQTLVTPTLTATLSENYVQQLATMTLTLGGVPTVGDAIGIVLSFALNLAQAVVPIAVAGDTASTMAAKAVTLLQANPTIMSWVSVVAVGPVITFTSLLAGPPVAIQANVGNGGTQLTEIGRRKRHFQIVVWSRTPDDRITVGDPIEVMIAQLEANFGLTFPDGTMGRMTFSGDTLHDQATLSDVARRDFFLCLDYGINVSDVTYAILAPIAQNTTF